MQFAENSTRQQKTGPATLFEKGPARGNSLQQLFEVNSRQEEEEQKKGMLRNRKKAMHRKVEPELASSSWLAVLQHFAESGIKNNNLLVYTHRRLIASSPASAVTLSARV